MNEFKKALQTAGRGEHFPVMKFTRQNPEMAAALSKAIRPTMQNTFDNKGNIAPQLPNVGAMRNLGMSKAQDITDAETVKRVLPDLQRTKEILISSILAPSDFVTIDLNYTTLNGLLPPEISSEMMDIVKTHLDQDYKITPKLSDIFGDALFDKGSYPIVVIPENTLDDVINSNNNISMESLQDYFTPDGKIRGTGMLGDAIKDTPTRVNLTSISMESLETFTPQRDVDPNVNLHGSFGKAVETFITVSDNPTLLKVPTLQLKIREQRIMSALYGAKVATESHGVKPLNDRKLMDLIYKDRKFRYNPISSLKPQDQLNRRSAGEALVIHLPPESVIPAYVPGNVREQIGIFVILDGEGHAVTRNTFTENMDIGARLASNSSFPSAMLNKVRGQIEGFDPQNQQHQEYSARIFGEMIEQELLARLRNGAYGDGARIAKNDKINYIMYARSLAQQHTQILFIPSELVTYIAFDYDDNGIGRSILDQMKIINSLRSAVRFANVTAGIKNAIGRTQVDIKLDPRDPDPMKSEEIIRHEVVRSRSKALPPIGLTSPTDIVDHLNLASMEFTTSGHEGMPDIKIDFSEKNSNYVKPDQDLSDDLRKDSIMAAGVPPELVDSGIPTEFATTIVSNNILLSKQVIKIQDIGTPLISDHLRKYITHTPVLRLKLMQVLVKNKDKLKTRVDEYTANKEMIKGQEEQVEAFVLNGLLKEFIANFEAHLPRPNSVTLENQLAALEVFEKGVDKVLEQLINSAFFTNDTGGDVAGQVEAMRALAKAQFMRRFISENGILPELSELTAVKEDGSPMLNIYKEMQDHVTSLMKSFTGLMVKIQPIKEAANQVMQAEAAGTSTEAPASTDDSSSQDDEGDGSGDEFDMGDFGSTGGLNDELGGSGDAAPAGSEEPAEGEEAKPDAGAEDGAAKKEDGEDDAKS